MENKENNGFGTLLKQRGRWFAKSVAFLLIVIVGAVAALWERTHADVTTDFYVNALVFSLLAWVLGQILRRLCLFAEEFRHRHSRYGGSLNKAFFAALEWKNVESLIIIASLVLLYNKHSDVDSFKVRLFLLNAIFLPAFLVLFGLNEPSRIEHSRANEKENKNLADGLAWSYYFGYLKFVLPALEGQINSSGERFRSGVRVKKLFILVPKNCVISDNHNISSTDNDPDSSIKVEGNLEPLRRSRGGILNREYKHTVHSIRDKKTGEPYLCIMEYATPIMTLHDMSNDPVAGLSREEKDIQVSLFVSKLREILDSREECKGKYEIITFAGGNQDIADIMIRALKDCAVEI